jgi:hypothetical protein
MTEANTARVESCRSSSDYRRVTAGDRLSVVVAVFE